MSEITKITEEQLETIKDQQAKIQAIQRDIGFLEIRKHYIIQTEVEVSKKLEVTKKELEALYGPINIDLTDGSYTVAEKEKESKPTMSKT